MPKAVHPGMSPGVTRTTSSSSMRRQQRVVSVRRASSTNKESSGEEETMEDEVVRLRGEVEALQKEVQRLLRLNAGQPNNDVATNKPSTVPPPPPTKKIPLRQQGPSTLSRRPAVNSLLTNKQPQHRNSHGGRGGRSHHHIDIVGELQNRSRHMFSIRWSRHAFMFSYKLLFCLSLI
jgi:hypothetical protein